ncbi:uncharacterized protein LOC114470354 [Gouania willdenowi]|uniref:uncharacterized protein LOC114470354 n=1 Tax=Gouania willdenowi TaxID=441366 RepID=UPI0010542540|nr:uncharacterized protein LOC114470354 [Gouania willdenowi]
MTVTDSQEVEESALEEIGKGLAVEESEDDNTEQEKVIAVTETLVKIVTGRQSEQEQEPIPGPDNVDVIRHEWGRGTIPAEKTQVEKEKDELIALPLDHLFLDGGQIEAEVAVEQEDLEYQQGLVVEQQAVKDEEAEVSDMSEAIGDITDVEREESVANVEGDQRAGEEEIALDTSGTEKKDQVLVISGPESEDQTPMEQSPENQSSSDNPSLGEVDTGENTRDTKQNQGKEIITLTGNVLPRLTAEAKPALDNSVNEQSTHPHTSEAMELGLEAWKIGAISAAALLALETVFIIIYILKCRNKSSSPAIQRTCEDGCVEPEAATGGDCSDDTLPAGNGDTQQIMLLDTSKGASMRAKTKEQKLEHAIAMPHLPPSTTEGSATTGSEQDSSQHENL